MGGRGSKSSSKVSGGHGKSITAEEFVKMSGSERVRTKIALNKKVKAGTATKAEKAYSAGRKERQKRARGERRRADKAWANVTNSTYERAQKRLNARVDSFYSQLK